MQLNEIQIKPKLKAQSEYGVILIYLTVYRSAYIRNPFLTVTQISDSTMDPCV